MLIWLFRTKTQSTADAVAATDLVLVWDVSSGENRTYTIAEIANSASSDTFSTWTGAGNTTGDANVVAVGAFALSSYYVFATNGRSSQLLNMVKDGSLSFGGIRGLITSAGSKWGNIMGTSLAVMFGYGAFFGSNKGLKRADQLIS